MAPIPYQPATEPFLGCQLGAVAYPLAVALGQAFAVALVGEVGVITRRGRHRHRHIGVVTGRAAAQNSGDGIGLGSTLGYSPQYLIPYITRRPRTPRIVTIHGYAGLFEWATGILYANSPSAH